MILKLIFNILRDNSTGIYRQFRRFFGGIGNRLAFLVDNFWREVEYVFKVNEVEKIID